MKDLVEMIAKALVDNPEQVTVTEVEGEQTTVLELRVAPTTLVRSSENRDGLPDVSEPCLALPA